MHRHSENIFDKENDPDVKEGMDDLLFQLVDDFLKILPLSLYFLHDAPDAVTMFQFPAVIKTLQREKYLLPYREEELP